MLKKQDLIKLLLVFLSILVYLWIFLAFVYFQNAGRAIFTIIPVMTIAWLYGGMAGLIAGILSLPFNMSMYQMIGGDWFTRVIKQGALIPGTGAIIVFGYVLGRISDLSRRLKKELAEKSLIEDELKQHRNNLEKEVYNTTVELQTAYHDLRAARAN